MSGWSRTVKPSADTTKDANDIYAVDKTEMGVTPGPAHAGYVHRRTVGNRVLYETLVAMKTPPTDAQVSGDDTQFPDVTLLITAQPASISKVAGQTATFTVTATTSSGTLAYQWQRQEAAGSTWSNVGTNANSYTTGSTTVLSDNGAKFRCVVSVSGSASVTSSTATLTVTAATTTTTTP